MAIEVFNRYETKYILTEEQYRRIKPQLEEYMEVDAHSSNGECYTICNIYYDTPDNAMIRKSIEKPIYKEKLRLRSYGVVGRMDRVYLEIKKKYNGCVNKRRISISLEDATRFIETKQKPTAVNPLNKQIINEIDFIIQRYEKLQPTLFLSYERYAMFGMDDKNFRVTFDTNIRTRRDEVGLDVGIYGERLLPEGVWIMEVKVRDSIPLWLAQLLSSNKIYPASFSKYGTEYQRTLSNSRINQEYSKQYA